MVLSTYSAIVADTLNPATPLLTSLAIPDKLGPIPLYHLVRTDPNPKITNPFDEYASAKTPTQFSAPFTLTPTGISLTTP
jgi:hypothetical protein